MKIRLIVSFAIAFCFPALDATSQHTEYVNTQSELIRQADSLMASYQFEKALSLLSQGDSLSIQILLRVGQCHFRLGASVAAIHPFERVLHMDSTNLFALNHLGLLYSRDGDYKKAFSSFRQLIKIDTANSYYYKQAGSMANRLGNATTARFWYKAALNLNPADTESSLALGNIGMEMEEYASVDSIVKQALLVDPHFKPLLLLRARSAFEQQDYEPVITTINALLEKADTTAVHARLLGISYFHLREYHKLITCMQFLLKNRYQYEWIYYYMGVAYRELGDVPASASWFKQAVEKSISENTTTYYAELGKSYEEMGDHQGAIKAYRAAYDYSKHGIMLYHLARNYDIFYKDKTTALAYYKKYLESDDTIRLAKEYARKRMQDMGVF